MLEWSEKVSKKYVSKELSQEIHNRVKPFISWLKEAEEESDSESEDDVEVIMSFAGVFALNNLVINNL